MTQFCTLAKMKILLFEDFSKNLSNVKGSCKEIFLGRCLTTRWVPPFNLFHIKRAPGNLGFNIGPNKYFLVAKLFLHWNSIKIQRTRSCSCSRTIISNALTPMREISKKHDASDPSLSAIY